MKNREVIFYDQMEDKLDALITVMLDISNSLEDIADELAKK